MDEAMSRALIMSHMRVLISADITVIFLLKRK